MMALGGIGWFEICLNVLPADSAVLAGGLWCLPSLVKSCLHAEAAASYLLLSRRPRLSIPRLSIPRLKELSVRFGKSPAGNHRRSFPFGAVSASTV